MTTLQRIGDSGWLGVPVNHIQGAPAALTAPPNRCWVKISLDYTPLAQEIFFDIVTHITTTAEQRRYLTAAEDRITINGVTLDTINVNRVALFYQIVTSPNLDIGVDFNGSPGTPKLNIVA